MADEFDLSGLRSALGVASTVIPKADQTARDSDALKLMQEELVKAQQRASTGDQRAKGDIDALNREILKLGGQPAQQANEFDLSGLRTALGVPIAQETTQAPITPRLFEPKTELEKSLTRWIESLPGAETLGAFGNVAAGTITKSVGAVQQLLGKYFPGLSEETRSSIIQNATQNVKATEQALKPIEEANPKAALAGEVTGFVVNPLNKLVPGFGGPAQSIVGAGLKGGAQGAIANALTTPVTNEEQSFNSQKMNQALTGGAFGGGFGVGVHLLGNALGKGIDVARQKWGGVIPANELDNAAAKIIAESGIDTTKIPQTFFTSLKDQAKSALQTGDVQGFKRFAQNYSEANSLPVPVPMLRGMLTRDPMQYAVEQNLRGIQGIGEPIQKILQDGNTALIQNLDAFGAKLGRPVVESGGFLRNSLKEIDAGEAQKVRDAYNAFRDSTGRTLNVPLQGLAQDYATVVKNYGRDTIPSGVRNNMEALGLMKGNQLKVTTIEDAENLIKNINANYDPSKQVKGTINALDELRRSVENSIKGAGANEVGQAGALAKAAREAASQRFDTIASIPALKSTMKGVEPDKFVQNYILQGNVDEISKLVNYLGKNSPETLAQLRNDVVGLIKNRVTNNVSDANAKFSQAALKSFVADGSASLSRLERFLSPEQVSGLKTLNRVAENALVEPVSAAVNRSNTASAAANIVQGTVKAGAINDLLTNIAAIKFPGVAWGANALRDINQKGRASDLIQQSVDLAARPATQIKTMVKPGIIGAGIGKGVVQQQNVQYEKDRNMTASP